MPDALLLLPDFLLIVCGYLICNHTPLGRPVWDAAERLVYHVLFPALLFTAILRHPLQPGSLWPLALCGVAVMALGIALASALRHWPGVDARLHASGAQTAYRFNTYIALAVAGRLSGTEGLAWIALLVALCVPIGNVAAVWSLARRSGLGVGRELLRNPLIVATVGGLAFNLLAIPLPDLLIGTATRMGSAALPIGLLAVGAGLRLGALREGPGLAAGLLLIRHLLLPAAAIALALLVRLPAAQQAVLVTFCAVSTSSSCYVLAARMGGHASYVAGLVTVSTLIGMAGLPLALMALRLLQGV
jgi:malonate transporter and related proteins